jgi:hypothetical protein
MLKLLFSKKVFVAGLGSASAMMLFSLIFSYALFGATGTIGMKRELLFLLIVGFVGAYTHEKIPRCASPMFERIWRYAGFLWTILFLPYLVYGVSFAVFPNIVMQTALTALLAFLAAAVIVPIMYKIEPYEEDGHT